MSISKEEQKRIAAKRKKLGASNRVETRPESYPGGTTSNIYHKSKG